MTVLRSEVQCQNPHRDGRALASQSGHRFPAFWGRIYSTHMLRGLALPTEASEQTVPIPGLAVFARMAEAKPA